MPVIIQYVVERGGKTKMTFTSKSEADAYDKLLDTAERLDEFLAQSDLMENPIEREALAMYLAENKDELLVSLGNKKASTKRSKPSTSSNESSSQLRLTDTAPQKPLEDLVIEPDEEAIYQEEESTVIFDQDDVESSHAA
ncbi:YebG family protein [Marinomonas sp. C2222]|uniref:YebG family protein n=1 Tax=Marinomonas sargassi TaxID=2984494 RepID=A0ABT2YQ67_9GAMM|nr:YebG family protein [Marinomonas sargassi]MCV2401900.1 YebG family protein [Marinomonas sargassi]